MNRTRIYRSPRLLVLESRVSPAIGVTSVISSPTGEASAAGGGKLNPRALENASVRSMSADGRFSVFLGTGRQMPTIASDVRDDGVFLFDAVTGATTLVSQTSKSPSSRSSRFASFAVISGNGRFVVYQTSASDVLTDTDGPYDSNSAQLYLYDRIAGQTTLLSHQYNQPSVPSAGWSGYPLISHDGSVICFETKALDILAPGALPPGVTNPSSFFLVAYDRVAQTARLMNRSQSNPNLAVLEASSVANQINDISRDGSKVLFNYRRAGLVGTTTFQSTCLYVYDRVSGLVSLVSHPPGQPTVRHNGGVSWARFSADGNSILYAANSSNLLPGLATGSNLIVYDVATGVNSIVSHLPGAPGQGASGSFANIQISANGRWVAYQSETTNTVAGVVDGNGEGSDAFVYDRLTQQTKLLSPSPTTPGQSAGGDGVSQLRFSDDGGTVVVASRTTDLLAGVVDRNGPQLNDAFAIDVATGAVRLVSGAGGSATQGSGVGYFSALNFSETPYLQAISQDGRYVTWTTYSNDIIGGFADTNRDFDIYRRDLWTGTTICVTRADSTTPTTANGESFNQNMTPDSRYVVFDSMATNLVPGQIDQPDSRDIFHLDRWTGVITLVSHAWDNPLRAGAALAGFGSTGPVISDDGQTVVYFSHAQDLIPGFIDATPPASTNFTQNIEVWAWSRATQSTKLLSRRFDAPATSANWSQVNITDPLEENKPAISADGRWIAFNSAASDIVPGFSDGFTLPNTRSNVYLHDRLNDTTTLITHSAANPTVGLNGRARYLNLSANGRYLSFQATGDNLIAGQVGTADNIFLYDRVIDQLTLVSHSTLDPLRSGSGGSLLPVMTPDGRYITFQSRAVDLVPGVTDANGTLDMFLYDRDTNTMSLISHPHDDPTRTAPARSYIDYFAGARRVISDDGRFVVYVSGADNIVLGFTDINGFDSSGFGQFDAYLYDRLTGGSTLISRAAGSVTSGADGDVRVPEISGNGRMIAFVATGRNLVSGHKPLEIDSNNNNLYTLDRFTGVIELVTHNRSDPLLADYEIIGRSMLNKAGNVLLFDAQSPRLVHGDFNPYYDVFAYVIPPPRVASILVDAGSAQRSVVRSLTVTFDQPVLFAGDPAAAFVVRRGSDTVAVSAAVANGTATTVTLTFSGPGTQFGWLVDGRYSLTVLSSQVLGIEALDGDADGLAGGDYVANFHRLFGDSNGDARVDSVDFLAYRLGLGQNNPAFDYDGNGTVGPTDFLQFRLRFLLSV